MKIKHTLIFFFLTVLFQLHAAGENGLVIKGVRHFSYPTFTRVVFEAEAAGAYTLTKTSDGKGLIFSAYEAVLSAPAQLPVINDGVVKGMELKHEGVGAYILIHLDSGAGVARDFVLRGPDRIVLDISRRQTQTSMPQTSSRTAVIVIDPGHGGRDSGLISSHGREKFLTLDISRALARALKRQDAGFNVVLTRDKDVDMSLDQRAAVANLLAASVFVSIHISEGSESRVYILEADAYPRGETKEGAKKEGEKKDFLGFEAETEMQTILWTAQQAQHTSESSALARNIARRITGRDKAAPLQAALALLSPVNAPAVLVEVSAQLDRARLVEALAKGIEQYVGQVR